jgi:hypothetical protein
MFAEEDGPAETAIGFTDQFVDAAIAKLDARFGAGYAKATPAALAAYVAACAGNLNAFMTAASAISEEAALGGALAAFEDEILPQTAQQPKKGRR